MTKNPQINRKENYIFMRYHFVSNSIKRKIVDIQFTKSEENITDILTKNMQKETFHKYTKIINNSKIKTSCKKKVLTEDQHKERKREDVKRNKYYHGGIQTKH